MGPGSASGRCAAACGLPDAAMLPPGDAYILPYCALQEALMPARFVCHAPTAFEIGIASRCAASGGAAFILGNQRLHCSPLPTLCISCFSCLLKDDKQACAADGSAAVSVNPRASTSGKPLGKPSRSLPTWAPTPNQERPQPLQGFKYSVIGYHLREQVRDPW